jgi:hypothetical protein
MRKHTMEPDTKIMSRTAGYTSRHKWNEDILEELRFVFRPGLRVAREKKWEVLQ